MDAIRTVTVTIGRNIDDAPMEPERWEAFQIAVQNILARFAKPSSWVETHYGVGEWEGVGEESAKLTILDATDAPLQSVTQDLEFAAGMFGQDAVAISTGTSMLVKRPVFMTVG